MCKLSNDERRELSIVNNLREIIFSGEFTQDELLTIVDDLILAILSRETSARDLKDERV